MASVREQQEAVKAVLKARLIGEGEAASNVVDGEDEQATFDGLIAPPYDPEALCGLLEVSNSLRQNVEAMATNIDGFGHHFSETIDPDADDAADTFRAAIWRQRVRNAEREAQADGEDLPDDLEQFEPEESEVETERERVRQAMRLEHMRLEMFFKYCCDEMSFSALRRITRQDLETMGNAYWEVLRDADGQIVQFVHVPAVTMRIGKADVPVEVDVRRQVTPLEWETASVRKRFRRFIQLVPGRVGQSAVFFKELGDPRVVSSRTGRAYEKPEGLEAAESGAAPATEILHFSLYNPRGVYGLPRWIGTLLAVLGSRESEEVNYSYFQNKSVPPLAVIVNGGRATDDTLEKIKEFTQNKIKGKDNFHRILLLEVDDIDDGTGTGGKSRVQIQPLTEAQQKDALFQEYDDRNIDKVGMAFRLPRLLRGDIRDFNRATADAAIEFAETQVFQPEREDFDWIINRKILTELGVKFYTYKSSTPTSRDPETIKDLLKVVLAEGAVTPAEVRPVVEELLGVDLEDIDAEWLHQPLALTLAGFDPAMDADVDDELGLLDDEEEEGEGAEEEEEPDEEEEAEVAQRAGGRRRKLSRRRRTMASHRKRIRVARSLQRLREQCERQETIDARAAYLAAKRSEEG